jgi:hypothetical protein
MASEIDEYDEDQYSSRKKRRKDQDCVQINVGGTIFATSKSMLMSNSSYFSSRFLIEWDDQEDGDGDDDDDEITFIDQDPTAFKDILGFMRHGFINKTEITQLVLVQADFFGIETLLRAVKCAAFRYMNPKTTSVSDDDVCQRFDDTDVDVIDAIKKGVLPPHIKKVRKEDARLMEMNS